MEQTFVMIKPDGVKLGLIGTITQRFENKRLRLVRSELRSLTVEQAKDHYRDLAGKSFFEELVSFITSGDVVAMVWEGPAAIKVARNLIGATNPVESLPGTIRGDFALELESNIIHGSDSLESAAREIDLFFPLLSDKQIAMNSISKVV